MTQHAQAPEADRSSAASDAFVALSSEVSLTTRDLPASVAWYRDVIGFTVDREHKREERLIAVSLRAGPVRLLLTQDDGSRGLDRAKGEGFSVQFTTAQDIDAIAARIKGRGVVLATEPFDAFGVRAFRLRDPDGFRLTISSPRNT